MNGRPAARWYYGWNIVAAASLLTMMTVGMRLGIGPFFMPMLEDLGCGRSVLSGIVAAGMLAYGLAMPVAGWLVGRFGTRTVLLLGTGLVLFSSWWTTVALTPADFLWSFGVLLSVGLGFTSPVALTPVISRWFTRQRGMALFFLSTGSMAGMAVMTPVLTAAIEAVGWRATMLGFAGAFALTTVPLALLVIRDRAPEGTDLLPAQKTALAARPAPVAQTASSAETAPSAPSAPTARPAPAHAAMRPAATAPGVGFGAALRTPPFWMIFLGLFACGFSMNLLGTHGVPMLMDHGFDAMTSAGGIGVIGLVAIAGTVVLGRLSDRVPRSRILAAIYFIRGLGFFALLVVGVKWELYLAAAIGGLVWAGSIAASSAILADVYGVRLVGLLYGWAYLGHQLGAMAGAWLGGWAYERYATHWIAFGSAGVLLLAAAAVSLRLGGARPMLPPAAVPARG